jgi:hypothetical protein
MAQLSSTTLKLFQECPRCFWLHVNRKIERPRGPFPSLPSGIDRILRTYFDGYRDSGGLPPLIAGKLDGALSTTPLTLGFNDDATRSRLWGKLDDCVLLPDGRVSPLDHKTRASAPDDISYTQTYYQFQMDVYTLLLERNGHRTTRTAHVIYYYPVAGTLHQGFPFEVAVHTIATRPDFALKIFNDAVRCLNDVLPDSAPACGYCRWAELRHAGPPPAAPSEPITAQAKPPARKAKRAVDSIPGDLFG